MPQISDCTILCARRSDSKLSSTVAIANQTGPMSSIHSAVVGKRIRETVSLPCGTCKGSLGNDVMHAARKLDVLLSDSEGKGFEERAPDRFTYQSAVDWMVRFSTAPDKTQLQEALVPAVPSVVSPTLRRIIDFYTKFHRDRLEEAAAAMLFGATWKQTESEVNKQKQVGELHQVRRCENGCSRGSREASFSTSSCRRRIPFSTDR